MTNVLWTGIMFSGSSSVFEMLKIPEMGLSDGDARVVAVPNPVVLKSRKMFATRSVVPPLAT